MKFLIRGAGARRLALFRSALHDAVRVRSNMDGSSSFMKKTAKAMSTPLDCRDGRFTIVQIVQMVEEKLPMMSCVSI